MIKTYEFGQNKNKQLSNLFIYFLTISVIGNNKNFRLASYLITERPINLELFMMIPEFESYN